MISFVDIATWALLSALFLRSSEFYRYYSFCEKQSEWIEGKPCQKPDLSDAFASGRVLITMICPRFGPPLLDNADKGG